ncbi:MAG: cysteine--tRNA ligase [Candidatus Macondimonas sp.]
MSALSIHNSLTGTKIPFQPLHPGRVGMYVCGMTVYDYCHLGHARVLVAFDVVARYLRHVGYDLTYVRNITDIDDKIIRRAAENGESIRALTERFIQAMEEDAAALGVMPPDLQPRATAHIDDIVAMIATLVDKGYAYVGSSGDVFYDVSRFDGYGKLSGRRPDDLLAGARVEVDAGKADPLDFVLWKQAKPDEPAWDSPWGPGRPGWHIECSAMATQCLGAHFDLHGGGMDLQFPHHENEIAQSEAATGEPFVETWMHVGFVQVGEEKMAKSLGNFTTIRAVLARYSGEVLRFFILGSHYRSPLIYTEAQLEAAREGLDRLYLSLRGLPSVATAETGSFAASFADAMNDDFNTSKALAVLFEMAREINRLRETDAARAAALGAGLRALGGVVGLLQTPALDYFQGAGTTDGGLDAAAIEALITARREARARRDWTEADRIRDELAQKGVVLEDGASGTVWRRT